MHVIKSYSFGSITIDGKTYTRDVIIYPDRVDSSWWRKEGHSLHPEDIKEVIDQRPQILIVGCGASGALKIPSSTVRYIESYKIKLISLDTKEACDRYNELSKDNKVIACLHLTC